MAKQRKIKREIKAVRNLLKNKSDSLSRHEINKIRRKLYKTQIIYDSLRTKPNLNDDKQRLSKRVTMKKIIYIA